MASRKKPDIVNQTCINLFFCHALQFLKLAKQIPEILKFNVEKNLRLTFQAMGNPTLTTVALFIEQTTNIKYCISLVKQTFLD